jgi:hypothetical protein
MHKMNNFVSATVVLKPFEQSTLIHAVANPTRHGRNGVFRVFMGSRVDK